MKEKTSPHTFRLPDKLFERLKEKAKYIPITVIVRRLIERYVNNEIELDD